MADETVPVPVAEETLALGVTIFNGLGCSVNPKMQYVDGALEIMLLPVKFRTKDDDALERNTGRHYTFEFRVGKKEPVPAKGEEAK